MVWVEVLGFVMQIEPPDATQTVPGAEVGTVIIIDLSMPIVPQPVHVPVKTARSPQSSTVLLTSEIIWYSQKPLAQARSPTGMSLVGFGASVATSSCRQDEKYATALAAIRREKSKRNRFDFIILHCLKLDNGPLPFARNKSGIGPFSSPSCAHRKTMQRSSAENVNVNDKIVLFRKIKYYLRCPL